MSNMKTKLISQTSRAGLALVVISFLLSLVPFQGKNLTTSKERTSAQTEVVVTNKFSKKTSFLFSFSPSVVTSPNYFHVQLARIHSCQTALIIKNLGRHLISIRRSQLSKTVFFSETEDHHIIA
jgi:hypothetical protein